MTIQELKQRIKNVPDETEVVVGTFYSDIETARYIDVIINGEHKTVYQISREKEED